MMLSVKWLNNFPCLLPLPRPQKTDPCHWRRHRRHIKGEGEGETEAEEVEEKNKDDEKEGKDNKVNHNASSPANMSESLRMTLEVVRDEQVFHARRKSRVSQSVSQSVHLVNLQVTYFANS